MTSFPHPEWKKKKIKIVSFIIIFEGAVVAQLASAQLSEREVSGSIFSDLTVKRSTDRGREVKRAP